MKKSNKHIRSASNRSVFVPISAGFCATALAITGGVVADASAVSSVASDVKAQTTKVVSTANSVTGGGCAEF